MPINRRADFFLNNKPLMLMRGQYKGRAWSRTGAPDSPSRRSSTDARYGALPDELDHPEVWDDWSGGFGMAYRRNGENTYHWSENFDPRWPRQLVHAQQLQLLPAAIASFGVNCNGLFELPWSTLTSNIPTVDSPCVMAYGQHWLAYLLPFPGTITTNYKVIPVVDIGAGYDMSFIGGPVLSGSYAFASAVREASNTTIGGFVQLARDTITFPSDINSNGLVLAGNRIWRHHGPKKTDGKGNYLQSADTSASLLQVANWSATLALGGGYNSIRSLAVVDDQVYAGMEDGLYAGDQGGTFYNVLSEISNQRHPDNCRDLTVYDGAVIAPHIAGLFSYRPGYPKADVREISPNSRSNRSAVRGYIRAVRTFGKWLYGGLYTGSLSYLMAGQDTPQGYQWHILNRLPHSAKISRIHFDGITTTSGNAFRMPNRLWIATDPSIDTGGTAPLYWAPVPLNNDNPLAADPVWSANYVGSARIDLGNVDWGAPSTPKFYRSVEVWADTLLSGYRYGDIYYDLDQSGSFAYLGRAQTSPKSILYFPDETYATTTNLFNDPSFEHGTLTDYWTIQNPDGDSIARSTAVPPRFGTTVVRAWPIAGHSAISLYQTITTVADTYVLSAYVRRDDGGIVVVSDVQAIVDGIGASFDYVVDESNGWYRCVKTSAVGAGAKVFGVSFSTGGYIFYVDGLQFERQGAVTIYCDGTQPFSGWTATANISTSSRKGGYITGQSIELSLRSFTASPALSPVYRTIALRGALRPNSLDEITAVVRIADNMKDRQGGSMRSAATMLQELRDLAESATPTTLIDLAGATSYVSVLAPIQEQEVYQVGEDNPEIAATVRLAVMTFS